MNLIALLGPDGAGKSTLVEELRRSAAPRSVTIHHFRPTTGPLHSPVCSPYGKEPHPFPVALAKVACWLLHYSWWGLRAKLEKPVRGDDIIIFDRFLYDVVADPRRYRLPPSVAELPIVSMVWPRPDLLVILQPPSATIQLRKQEVSAEDTSRQLLSYDRLFQGDRRVLRVHDARSPDELARLILSRLAESR